MGTDSESPGNNVSAGLKRTVRRVALEPAKRSIDAWRLRRAVAKVRAGDPLDANLIGALHRAWGNESYSADPTYLSHVATQVAACRGPILECGSGITTVLAAVLAEQRALTIWCLEQDAEWTAHMTRVIATHRIANARVMHAPLRHYDGFIWYALEGLDLPLRFDLVICDGPAVFEHWGAAHAQWRYGVLPVLTRKGIDVGRILLDDATEPRAPGLLDRWSAEFDFEHRLMRSPDGDCALASRRLSDNPLEIGAT